MKQATERSPAARATDSVVPLESVLCCEELNRRPWRPPNHEAENRALAALAQALADSPRTILQTLAEKILEVFRCGSAGISLLTTHDGGKRFHWPAIAGVWKDQIGGGTPRDFGPCGDVLDRNSPLLFRRPERRYTYFEPVAPPVEECLLVPFYVEGRAVGTIWAIAHNDRRKFDAEDLRQLESLGRFASAAYQAVTFLNMLELRNESLRQNQTELTERLADLQQANAGEQEARRAALTLMEEAVRSRRQAETLNLQLCKEITEREQAEEALRQRTAQVETLLNEAPLGMYLVDADFRVRQVNPTALPVFGNIPDLIGRDFDEVIHILWPNDYADEIVERFRHTLETGKCHIVTERNEERRDRGVREFYEWQINRIPLPEGRYGVVCYFRDISRQVLAREAIAESEARLRFMAESMPQKIFTATPSGEIDYFNRQWMDFTGVPFEQIGQWGWTQFIHPDDVEENVRLWKHSLDSGEPFMFIHRFRRFDGIYRWHLSRACAMRNIGGEISMWIGSNTEIHEQKETEEQLTRANADLKQFAFAASHDLQEPLRMITNYSQMLVEGYRGQLEDDAAVCVGYIADGSKRIRELLEDLLSYTQAAVNGDEAAADDVDLNVVFAKVMQNLSAAVEESGGAVACDHLPVVRGLEGHFVQLIQNLVANAIKYRSGRLLRIHLGAEQRNDEWLFTMADNGIGIEPKYHQQIFGLFKRLHGKKIPGTGIGLAICQRVVERYGGRIWVESALNNGAIFYFTLPRGGA